MQYYVTYFTKYPFCYPVCSDEVNRNQLVKKSIYGDNKGWTISSSSVAISKGSSLSVDISGQQGDVGRRVVSSSSSSSLSSGIEAEKQLEEEDEGSWIVA
jgi:hypothetical protein